MSELSAVKDPMELGMDPDREFVSSDSTVKERIAPILAGIGPVSRFSNIRTTWRAASDVKLDGIEPANELKPKSRYCSDDICPMVEGMEPAIELLPITNLVKLRK